MKRLSLVLAALVLASPLLGDQSHTSLLTARSTVGASSAIYAAASPAPSGGEHWFFVKTGDGVARLEISSDSGATWAPYALFKSPSDLVIAAECGGCRFRAYVTSASATATVSVSVCVSGVVAPVVNP